MYGDFQTVDSRTGKTVRCQYQAIILAISTRHADAVDVKFLVEGETVVVSLPHVAWGEYNRRTGKVLTDPMAVAIAGHFLKTALDAGEDSGRQFHALTLAETMEQVDSLTRADLEKFHQQWFHPANFVVAASGDFDREQMVQKLEALFADWPFKGETPAPIPTNTTFAATGVYLVNKGVNQGRVAMMLPGILRYNPDYFAVVIMNDILGGGGFTSRIMNRVRSDEGLAYDAHSIFQGGIYYPLTFTAGFQSKSRTVAYAASLVLDEMKKMAAAPVTDSDLNISKRGFIDRFPRAFSTKAQVATIFAQDEFTGRYARQPDYYKTYRSRMEAISREDVLRVAKKYLTPDQLVILAVGQKDQILLGHPDHPVKLTELVKGPLTDVPLRDPMTMKPLGR